ncbi:hypothetical protein BB560_000772 [Smittium megazygosporum]|uniref:Uncharacterized protein n=1 Tax=Smittium megazygosporum TaxID=133381 RepID=A0A2T9ZJH5_9FUNG|nr:hypothetical protein BB560_000772 [Smittium megazygosporum]
MNDRADIKSGLSISTYSPTTTQTSQVTLKTEASNNFSKRKLENSLQNSNKLPTILIQKSSLKNDTEEFEAINNLTFDLDHSSDTDLINSADTISDYQDSRNGTNQVHFSRSTDPEKDSELNIGKLEKIPKVVIDYTDDTMPTQLSEECTDPNYEYNEYFLSELSKNPENELMESVNKIRTENLTLMNQLLFISSDFFSIQGVGPLCEKCGFPVFDTKVSSFCGCMYTKTRLEKNMANRAINKAILEFDRLNWEIDQIQNLPVPNLTSHRIESFAFSNYSMSGAENSEKADSDSDSVELSEDETEGNQEQENGLFSNLFGIKQRNDSIENGDFCLTDYGKKSTISVNRALGLFDNESDAFNIVDMFDVEGRGNIKKNKAKAHSKGDGALTSKNNTDANSGLIYKSEPISISSFLETFYPSPVQSDKNKAGNHPVAKELVIPVDYSPPGNDLFENLEDFELLDKEVKLVQYYDTLEIQNAFLKKTVIDLYFL